MNTAPYLLAVAEVNVEARIVPIVAVSVDAAVLVSVALRDDVREPVEALLLRVERALEVDLGVAPRHRGGALPVAAAAECLAGVVHAGLGLAGLAAGGGVAGGCECGGRERGEGSSDDGEPELHGGASYMDHRDVSTVPEAKGPSDNVLEKRWAVVKVESVVG